MSSSEIKTVGNSGEKEHHFFNKQITKKKEDSL